ncbi:hypothetical protein [Blastococcus sp. CT_GayMR16]|uniref:hypothetical protein n=1 Tax=Blastococcus sp. CT_GayMR16 TaxID=2559607 RepID=UPI001073B0A0|nr:hypothetical protein [Blastococcus sp. CT_GayMR16]TFV90387.1 hypothetical protein E4P38_02805 [Blastococcus sp. CT_GayMR16]
MSTPAVKKTTVKKTAVKRSPRAAKPTAGASTAISEEEFAALREDLGEQELAPGEIRPVIIGKRGRRGDVPVAMVTLFELDDVPYQIPRNPSAALVLSWLLDAQKAGTANANFKMGVELLGEEPLNALKASPEVEPEDLADIFSNIGTVFFSSENYQKVMAAPDPS